jgi:hypothetical protein
MALIGETKTTLSVPMNMSQEMLTFAQRQASTYSIFRIEGYLRAILNSRFLQEWGDFGTAYEKKGLSIYDALIRDGYLSADWNRQPPSPPAPI